MMYEEIENFLDEKYFQHLYDKITKGNNQFPWLFQGRQLAIYKKKEIQSIPGRQVIPAENFRSFQAAPHVTITGFFNFLLCLQVSIFV